MARRVLSRSRDWWVGLFCWSGLFFMATLFTIFLWSLATPVAALLANVLGGR